MARAPIARKSKEPVAKKEAKKPDSSPKQKSPKKKVAKKSNVARKTKPTYQKMIKRALTDIEHPQSVQAISKFIVATYPVGETYKRYLKQALKAGLAAKLFVKVRGSFRLSVKSLKKTVRRKKSTSKSPSKKTKKTDKKSGSKSPKPKKAKKIKKEDSAKKTKKAPKKPKATTATATSSTTTTSTATSPEAPKRGRSTGIKKTEASKESSSPTKLIGSKYDHHWQYHDGTWKDYDAKASDTVEETYLKYLENRGETDVRAVKSGQWEYQVDFMAMKQTNIQHEQHTVRNIRRM